MVDALQINLPKDFDSVANNVQTVNQISFQAQANPLVSVASGSKAFNSAAPNVNNVSTTQQAGIKTERNLTTEVASTGENLKAQPATSSILGDCLDQVKALGHECSSVVGTHLPALKADQVIEPNITVDNQENMQWHQQQATLDNNLSAPSPNGMS